jgi:hypothetical protein
MQKQVSGQIVETAVEARGGLLGRPVLLVLTIGTFLAVMGLALVWGILGW